MGKLFITILPLGLGSAVSPTLFAVVLVILSSRSFPKIRGLAYAAGITITTLVIGIAGYFLTGLMVSPASNGSSSASAYIDLTLGILLLLLAGKNLVKKKDKKKKRKSSILTDQSAKPELGRFFILGVIMMATNLTSIPLYLDAIKEVVASSFNLVDKTPLLLFLVLMILVPVIIPLFLYFLSPKFAERILQPINKDISKYSNYIAVAIFLIFGIYLISKGLLRLL